MSDRNMKNIFGREKIKPMLPVARRTEGDEYFVPAGLEVAGQIDKVPFCTAIVPGRRNVQYPHD